MKKLTYKLTTLSSLVVSPRDNKAFYEALNEFCPQEIKNDSEYLTKDRLKIIYPFYRYGEYTAYMPESAKYYLPGTSVKGALCLGNVVPGSLMIDDVQIPNSDITLRNLYKAQYLEEIQKACFGVFFENVGVEMIKPNAELMGEIYIKEKIAAETLLRVANRLTKDKIAQMLQYLRELQNMEYKSELLCALKNIEKKLLLLADADNICLFGGYKGLLHSINIKNASLESKGAVFMDQETMLPHGIVRIEFI